ncbi:Heparanase [Vespula squamosa]|uniref:Heparanase n=1 Tax=Vespula squamosa TaxID=30214 RepID=A0ABD2BDT5_VESSQ
MGRYTCMGKKNMIYHFKDGKGYTNYVSLVRKTILLMSQLNLKNKEYLCTSGEAPSVPTPPISDDTDLQFWAEDELSNTESKHKLVGRHKRRYSLAYRNRNKTYKNRSFIIKSLIFL